MDKNEYFASLSVGLPADIERRRQHGDYEGAVRLIDRRLAGDLPEALRRCLIVEREILLRTPRDYPFDRDRALEVIRADIPDLTGDEFDELVDDRKIDWIYVNGEERYIRSFYGTLCKAYPEFGARAGRGESTAERNAEGLTEKQVIGREIEEMKRKGSASWRIRMRGSIRARDEKFVPGRKLRAWLPIPSPAARQISDVEILSLSDAPCVIAPEDAPQRTVFFEESPLENRAYSVEYAFTNTVSYTDAYGGKGIPGSPGTDLGEIPPHVVFTPYIRSLAESLTAGKEDPLERARAVYDFITKNVRYSFMREYFCLESIAESAARDLRGDCGVQALLFIALCRCAGVPARWQSGRTASPMDTGMHDWAEFYAEPYGWLFADPSFGGSAFRSGDEERRRFYFGNLDPFRMPANGAFQQPFFPASTQWRRDPYDNQAGEMETEDGPLTQDDTVRETTVLSCEKIG